MTSSLTFNNFFQKWGIYYSLSDDLVHWSQRRLVKSAELIWTHTCGDADPIGYPSVLDPSSRSRNFETTGQSAYLSFTRFRFDGCQQTLNRDLIRVPIRFRK